MGVIALVRILTCSIGHIVAAQFRLDLGLAERITSEVLRSRGRGSLRSTQGSTASSAVPTVRLRPKNYNDSAGQAETKVR